MARQIRVAAAQLGPIHLADDRASVVRRLVALLREAHAMGAQLVVFPELALTTFFPRYWYDEIAEIDAWFEREMPNAATAAAVRARARARVGFYLGYAELAEEGGATHRYNTSILVGPDGQIIGKYRKVHLPGHADHRAGHPVPAPREALLRGRQPRLSGLARVRRGRRHDDLQRPPLARGLPGHGPAGGRADAARLQHADPQHLPPRALASAHVPQPPRRSRRAPIRTPPGSSRPPRRATRTATA